MALHESGENYLEQILVLQRRDGFARSIDIANALNVTKPSVSIAMKHLRERGYISMDHESHIRLTEAGFAVAERIDYRHRKLVECLMHLGVSEEQAREDACKMEHDISEDTFHALCKVLDMKKV